MGCADSWPSCDGTFFPGLNFEVFMEWGHRLLAATAGALIIATVVKILRSPQPQNSALKRSGQILLILLGTQVLLGGITVMLGLSVIVSTIHLVIATLVFSGLIGTACASTWPMKTPIPSQGSSAFQWNSLGLVLLLAQFVLGGLVRHGHAGLACPSFPHCTTQFLPHPWTFETTLAFSHRWVGFILFGYFIYLAIHFKRQSSWIIVGLGLMQVLLGIFTVLSTLSVPVRAVHAALGYGIWAVLFYQTVRMGEMNWVFHDKHGYNT